MYKLFMALRYLRAHKIIYFSIVGVAVGIMVMIIVTSVMGGFSRDIKSRIRGLHSHLVVQTLYVPDYGKIADGIAAIPHVTGCAPRLEYMAWLGSGAKKHAVMLVGIDPARERTASELSRFFARGSVPVLGPGIFADRPAGEPVDAVTGYGISDWKGQELSVTTAIERDFPELRNGKFKVVGHFKSGMNEYDAAYIFVSLKAMQEFLRARGDGLPYCNQFAIGVDDYEKNGEEVRRAVLEHLHRYSPNCNVSNHAALGRCGKFWVKTWEDEKANLLAAVEIEKGVQFIVMFFIVIVAGFNIIAIYTLMVRSKTRDIGILRALGGTKGGVISIFLTSGAACGLVGSLVGIGSGLLLAHNLNSILDFLRIGSRELNSGSFAKVAGTWTEDRGGVQLAWVLAAAALAWLIASWVRLYKPWKRADLALAVVTGAFLAASAWVYFAWVPDYEPRRDYDWNIPKGLRLAATLVAGLLPVAWCGLRRATERWTETFAGGTFRTAGTILYFLLVLWALTLAAVPAALAFTRPEPRFSGYDLFPRDIYYLDRVPVFVDSRSILVIVVLTLVVSLVCSIYPALRAARTDPIEAIRDE